MQILEIGVEGSNGLENDKIRFWVKNITRGGGIESDEPYSPTDLTVSSSQQAAYVFGCVDNWNEESLLKQIQWAAFIGMHAVILPHITETATNSSVYLCALTKSIYLSIWVRVKSDQWSKWNSVCFMCNHNPRLGISLELTSNSSIDPRWRAEPIKLILIPTTLFTTNKNGFPSLHKSFQLQLQWFMKSNVKFAIQLISPTTDASDYIEYLNYLSNHMPLETPMESFANGYEDVLQIPLQPLMDNLESATYEGFEQDPVKYQKYQDALTLALKARPSTTPLVVMILGAGRGPLIQRALTASTLSSQPIHIYALEKNPNAFVLLQSLHSKVWKDSSVELYFGDMRQWNPPEKADIIVSELLGSFGDNELSPECLDGAQRLLKIDGICIPFAYSSFLVPLSCWKLYGEVGRVGKGDGSYETPYVVQLRAVDIKSASQFCWKFSHKSDSNQSSGIKRNSRYAKCEFVENAETVIHGFAGYFEAELYGDVGLSIRPVTHSEGMLSWFPIYFPVRRPLNVPSGANVVVDIWRKCDERKVWYEWCITLYSDSGEFLSTSGIHNVGGHAYWIGI